jgi:hypothetical protein
MGPTGKNNGHVPDHHRLSTSKSESRSKVVGTESESNCEDAGVVSEKTGDGMDLSVMGAGTGLTRPDLIVS